MKKFIPAFVMLFLITLSCDRTNLFEIAVGITITTGLNNLHIGETIDLHSVANLEGGGTRNISKNVTYTSSDETVIVIEEAGKTVRARVIMDGSSDITAAYTPGSTSFTSMVTASVSTVTAINLYTNENLLDTGSTTTLFCEVIHADGERRQVTSPLTYNSSDIGIADVTAEGIVTATGSAGETANIDVQFDSPFSGTHNGSTTIAIVNAFYVAEDGVDTNPGTGTLPFRTIQMAVDAATTGNLIKIAGGEYPINASILLDTDDDGVMIHGGYRRADWVRDSYNNQTVIRDNRTTGSGPIGAIEFEDVSNSTFINQLTIIGPDSGDADWAGIKCTDASPDISGVLINLYDSDNNGTTEVYGTSSGSLYGMHLTNSQSWISSCYIYGGNAPVSNGIYAYANTANLPSLINNHIVGGTSGTSIAVNIDCTVTSPATPLYNNVILAGSGSTTMAIIVSRFASPDIMNNTISTGNGSSRAYGIQTNYSSTPAVINNIFISDAGAPSSYGIYEQYPDADPVSVKNNNFFNLTYVYRDHDSTTDIVSAADLNVDGNVAGATTVNNNISFDPVFQNPGDNYNLTAGSPIEVTEGGLNGIDEGWSNFPTDIDGYGVDRQWNRRPDSGNPWSIGAFQYK